MTAERIVDRARSGLVWAGSEALARLPLGSHVAPRAFLIGAQKAGTTSLFTYLARHPAVAGGTTKEVHYFDLSYGRGARWYESRFPQAIRFQRAVRSLGVEPLTIDATPYYLFHPLVAARLHAYEPDAKLIVLLRDPVERAYSHWWHERRRRREPLGFAEAIAAEPERLAGEQERLERSPDSRSGAHRHLSYVARGRYAEQLERWLMLFPRDQLLVVFTADLERDPAAVVERTLAFLELPPLSESTYPRRNQGGYQAAPREDVVASLRAQFAEPDAQLEQLLGIPVPWTARLA